jgi:hypothetical protein
MKTKDAWDRYAKEVKKNDNLSFDKISKHFTTKRYILGVVDTKEREDEDYWFKLDREWEKYLDSLTPKFM